MTARARISLLNLILTVSSFMITGITIAVLYHAALEGQKDRLLLSAKGRARLMESVARFDAIHNSDYPGGAFEATLSQIRDAHQQFRVFGRTGEVVLAKKEGNRIVFLMTHTRYGLAESEPISTDSGLAEPMFRALSGKSGVIIGRDYSGHHVLAAYEPVAVLNLGIVTKIDMDEIREPFIRAGLIAICFTIVIVLIGAGFSYALIRQIGQYSVELQRINKELNLRIAERKQAEEALRNAAHYTRSLIEASLDPLVAIGYDGRITDVNKATESVTGHSREELVGSNFANYFTEPEKAEAGYNQVFETGSVRDYELNIRHKNGDITPVVYHASVYLDQSGKIAGVFAAARDISVRRRIEEERLKLERRLLQAHKSESLGRMAAGISHDFNNILMAVMGNTELAMYDLPPESSSRRNLENAMKSAKRAAELIHKILTYSGSGFFVFKDIDLSGFIGENIQQLMSAIPRNISFRTDLTENLPRIKADPEQLRQMLINILVNASEAMTKTNGTVILSTGITDICEDSTGSGFRIIADSHEKQTGQFVYIGLSDTGCGMSRETLKLLTDPFFTTKFMGRGLGMSEVQGIVRTHRGAILVKSELGKGTTFRILFPVSETARRTSERKIVHPEITSSGSLSKMVFVVDDEESVREVCDMMLNHLGYRTLMAEDGDEAVKIFQERADEIDCVLLDLTMPKLDGISAWKEMRRIRADMKVIISSGHSKEEISEKFKEYGFAGVLQKPFEFEDLKKELDTAVRKNQGSSTLK